MSSPLSATKFRNAITGEGVAVVEVGDWTHHNRAGHGAWGPVHGVMIHHTVTSGTANSVAICRDGYSTLPGPLCHGVIAKDGTVHLVGYGRANHAGLGDDDVLAAVQAERSPLPADNEANTDGNSRFYGFECVNLGDNVDPWPEVQVEAIARTAAGICRAHGWGAESVIGHLEWQPGKVDPRGPIGKKGGPALTMDKIRARVEQLLDDDKPTTPAPSQPARKVVDLSQLIAAARRDPAKSGTPVSYAGARIVEDALAAEGLLAKKYVDGHFGTTSVTAYRAWQRRCGYSGAAADGIPGRASLDTLAKRHGFDVAA
ncbi:N-acetylmuramoyl-L-alanine amidase [Streptomyces europaeiscabiei]|uniref:N-acetylmuramoyl-L-alanine amidase n=1 Tax=Streptomyces europaeiscabiei TaxID=146819 RepID=UPI0029ACF540|nr:N-acetylmuramoyl-L-alanine amidase [Streptomyces europaeiscabiei]MDX3841723.1 N-acetylmuramoyl-L-alanine amidase [Streptomyces europaeiscabiei]